MSETTKFKQRIALLSFFASCLLFFIAGTTAIGLFLSREPGDRLLLSPLVVEPDLIDFQEVNEGEHEGLVHFINQSDRNICFLFAKSGCSCSVLKLPNTPIAPGERIPVKCALSTIGRTGRVGGVILIAYRFCDSNEEVSSPVYVSVTLQATVSSSNGGTQSEN